MDKREREMRNTSITKDQVITMMILCERYGVTKVVHTVLPPPFRAFAWKNPSGQPQNVALFAMQDMEVFEMADSMEDAKADKEKDEMAMFFFVVSDLDQAISVVGKNNCSAPFEQSPGRRGVILGKKKLGLSVLTFLVEPPPTRKEEGAANPLKHRL